MMRTPSPQSSLRPRPNSPQLFQHSQDECVPDGYVRRQVAEKDLQQLHQHAHTSLAHKRELDEMMRRGAAQQQQEQARAERMMELEREDARHRQRESDLRKELSAAQVLAEHTKNHIILEERSVMHMAEERSAPCDNSHQGQGRGAPHDMAIRGGTSSAR